MQSMHKSSYSLTRPYESDRLIQLLGNADGDFCMGEDEGVDEEREEEESTGIFHENELDEGKAKTIEGKL
jgi:hypothetical protein